MSEKMGFFETTPLLGMRDAGGRRRLGVPVLAGVVLMSIIVLVVNFTVHVLDTSDDMELSLKDGGTEPWKWHNVSDLSVSFIITWL
jgi:hypothetical protein